MNFSDRRILVTGATGLIGRELLAPLRDEGFDVYAVTIDANNPDNGIHWLKGDLFDDEFVRRSIKEVEPTHLLNMAWATTGDYLSSDVNYKYLSAGLTLAQAFAKHGGRRAVFAGTCFEYRFKNGLIKEDDELEPDKFAYTVCKDALRRLAGFYFHKHGVSFGYGRIFYVFGKGEAKTRLTGMIIDKLSRNEVVEIKSGKLLKDYMYTKDIAGAFAKFVGSDVSGCVNICTGHVISVRDFALGIAGRLGKEHLIRFVDVPNAQPPIIVGDNSRLVSDVGYVPKWPMEVALDDLLG